MARASLGSSSLPDSPGFALRADAVPTATPYGASGNSYSESSDFTAAPLADTDGTPGQGSRPNRREVASHRDKYIDPQQRAPALSAGDKFQLGLRNSVSPFSALGWLTSAAYSQAINSSPNYGQGWGPFAQRFGAAAARGTSEGILSDSVFAPLFHEDPRYYRLGRGHSIIHRGVYAATRTVITKNDSGRATPNFSLFAGNAAGSILTNAYYPQQNRTAKDTVETFAGSIGGSALGFVVSEFLSDTLQVLHLKRIE